MIVGIIKYCLLNGVYVSWNVSRLYMISCCKACSRRCEVIDLISIWHFQHVTKIKSHAAFILWLITTLFSIWKYFGTSLRRWLNYISSYLHERHITANVGILALKEANFILSILRPGPYQNNKKICDCPVLLPIYCICLLSELYTLAIC